ncbi:MAG TPA: UDP-N-acetylglucosamine--N-acetylmuramyl-(pentapeptide) pyrophosphoryl-undecaprenol N-acetylglucosamine transferase [Candidatus Paceibacterota bacterium]
MRIVLTGGGTGGHFYPAVAVADRLREVARAERLIEPELYFLAPDPYDAGTLFDHGIKYRRILAGKTRRYFSPLNIVDWVKVVLGAIGTLWTMYKLYPDVVFSKGGYGAFPVVFAARVLRIPVVMHESDSKPGRVNAWTARFAERIAVSYPSAAEQFPAEIKSKVAWTGNPVRSTIARRAPEGAREYLKLEEHTPTLLVLGGSQGAQAINRIIIESLKDLTADYQIIHQTGKANFEEARSAGGFELEGTGRERRYLPFPYLDDLALRMSAGAADLVVTRAGSSLFEVASWGLPAIVIPIPEAVAHDQRENAYAYARSGSAVVLEEPNLTRGVFVAEVRRVMDSEPLRRQMSAAAVTFNKPDADLAIAKEILAIGLLHEPEV